MTNGNPPKPPTHRTEEARFNDEKTDVFGAIGRFLSGSGGGTPSPYGSRGGTLMSGSVGSLIGTGSSSARGGGGSSVGGPSGVGGAVYSPVTPSAARVTPASTNVARGPGGSGGSGGVAGRSGSFASGTANAANASRPTGAQRLQAAVAARGAQRPTAARQRRIDVQSAYQTSTQKAADPLNWAGIAKDLGNAGVADFSQYKTGGRASTNAMRFKRGQPLKAPVVMAPKAARPARGGSKTVRAV